MHPSRFIRFLIPALFLADHATPGELHYSPSPVDNPLKGLVPYLSAEKPERFPHSLKFQYFPFNRLVTGPEEYDWDPLEGALEECRFSGCQLVIRVFLEYPGRSSAIPDYLIEQGLPVSVWEADGQKNQTPDYEDPALRVALGRFIAAFGRRYDGDPRIGFITAGLLGMWGEWHTYPREDLWASKETQIIVLDAYEKAFSDTRILLRYPAGKHHEHMAPTFDRPFGYHDDSFAWATLITGRPGDEWFFNSLMKNAGTQDTWKRQPIGGEIRPELWPTLFTKKRHPNNQGFDRCVSATHASWLLDSGLFDARFPMTADRLESAVTSVRKMGYEFTATAWHHDRKKLTLTIHNRGNAPFYYNWPVSFAVFENGKHIRAILKEDLDLIGILPGQSVDWVVENFPLGPQQEIRVGLLNPMENGKALRFANREQEGNWLVLRKAP